VRRDRSPQLGPAEILVVVFGEGRDFCCRLPRNAAPRAVRFEAGETLAHVSEESGLALFAVGHDVDPALDLPADSLGHRAPNARGVSLAVVGLIIEFGLHHVEQVLRARQAADMGGQDPVDPPLHELAPLC